MAAHHKLGTFRTPWINGFLAVALATPGFAQSPNSQAAVEGVVVNSAGKPVGRATVALVGNNRTATSPLPPAYRTTSGADGAFRIDNVEPNTYRIFIQRSGYLDFVYIQPDGRVAVAVAEGKAVKIEAKLTAPSVVGGRVTDEEGEPLPDARVRVLRLTRSGVKKQLTALPPIAAGPDGSFTIGRLIAGRYYVSASNPPSLTETSQREIHNGTASDERYVTTYHPSAIDTTSATLVDLAAETELRNLDIRLRRARVFHIAGKVQAAGGSVSNATITLIRPGLTDISDMQNNANRIFAVGGSFQVNGLLPGIYAFQAWLGPSREMQGHLTVAIADHDVDNAVLSLVPALEIPLSVRIEDAAPKKIDEIRKTLGRFTLTASDGVNTNAMAEGKDDGTWVFHNIGPGTYRMGLGGPDGTYVRSVRYGDRDITNRELDTTTGGAALVMVLSPHAAEISGNVKDSNGQPLSGVTVTLWLPGTPPPGTIDQARSTMTDAAGSFRFGNLPPGEYRIAAWERVEPGLPYVTEFHAKFDSDATTVTVREDSREKVQPVLISRQKVEAVSASIQ